MADPLDIGPSENKDAVPGYDIFMSFIKNGGKDSPTSGEQGSSHEQENTSGRKPVQNPPGNMEVDALGMFTRECYDKWLETRMNKVNHPEQTFHRIIIAHIRGADSRKPFPEDVETAILKLLRQKKHNIWDNVFGDNKKNVGKRGFKQLGYHEAKRALAEEKRLAAESGPLPKIGAEVGAGSGSEAETERGHGVKHGDKGNSVKLPGADSSPSSKGSSITTVRESRSEEEVIVEFQSSVRKKEKKKKISDHGKESKCSEPIILAVPVDRCGDQPLHEILHLESDDREEKRNNIIEESLESTENRHYHASSLCDDTEADRKSSKANRTISPTQSEPLPKTGDMVNCNVGLNKVTHPEVLRPEVLRKMIAEKKKQVEESFAKLQKHQQLLLTSNSRQYRNESVTSSLASASNFLSRSNSESHSSLDTALLNRMIKGRQAPKLDRGFLAAEDAISSEYLSSLMGLEMNRHRNSATSNTSCISPWDELVKSMVRIGHPEYLDWANEFYRSRGRNAFDPAALYLLKQPLIKNDPRFDESFLFPGSNEVHFLADRPIGRVTMNLKAMSISNACPVAKILLRYNPVGDLLLSWHVSLAEMWFGHLYALTKCPYGEVYWKRSIRYRGDGSLALFLTRQTPTPEGYGDIFVEFQDHSDLYPQVLNRPYFI